MMPLLQALPPLQQVLALVQLRVLVPLQALELLLVLVTVALLPHPHLPHLLPPLSLLLPLRHECIEQSMRL
jgi:hypothetical protein